jgi:hypothetical protein
VADPADGVGDRQFDAVPLAQRADRRAGLDPSATWPWLAASASARLCPRPSRSPKVRLRDSGDEQVATRSPSPASPAKVSGSAPSATPRRAVSASPRVMSEARVLSPNPIPAATPQASAMTFLPAPPSSQPITSVLV